MILIFTRPPPTPYYRALDVLYNGSWSFFGDYAQYSLWCEENGTVTISANDGRFTGVPCGTWDHDSESDNILFRLESEYFSPPLPL